MLPPPEVIVHDTAVFVVPVTVLVKLCVFPNCTEADDGDTFTTTCAATTDSATLFPVIDPAPGWRTLTCNVPVAAAVPAAISLVGDT